MCLILCCKPLKAARHGGQFLQTLWSDPRFPMACPYCSTCWQEESDRQARRTPFETPVRLQARFPSRVTMATVFNSSVYVHGSRSCVKMCMPLITYRLSSFHVVVPWKPGHFKRLWPGFYSHYLLTESLDLSLPPGLGRGTQDKRIRHKHLCVWQPDWCRGRQGLVCGGLRRIAECCGIS